MLDILRQNVMILTSSLEDFSQLCLQYVFLKLKTYVWIGERTYFGARGLWPHLRHILTVSQWCACSIPLAQFSYLEDGNGSAILCFTAVLWKLMIDIEEHTERTVNTMWVYVG